MRLANKKSYDSYKSQKGTCNFKLDRLDLLRSRMRIENCYISKYVNEYSKFCLKKPKKDKRVKTIARHQIAYIKMTKILIYEILEKPRYKTNHQNPMQQHRNASDHLFQSASR